MSVDTVIDLSGRQSFSESILPFIFWERPVHRRDGVIVEKKPMLLFDKYGGPYVWVDPLTINYYLKKGWKIVDYGNFDFPEKYLGKRSEHLDEIASIVTGQSESYQKLAEQSATIEAQGEEIKRLQAELAKNVGSAKSAKAPAGEKLMEA